MQYSILDVFTDQMFKGNPLAVVLNADGLPVETMQAVAREFNLSETTFVMKPTVPRAQRRIRIFTPVMELPLAGHPVVGTWYLLAADKHVQTSEGWNTFHQQLTVGVLPVEILVEGPRVSEVRMTQATPQFFEQVETPRLLQSLRLTRDDLNASLPAQFVSTGVKQLMLPFQRREALRRIQLDASALVPILTEHDSHLVYAFAEENDRIYARGFFCAGSASFEDPATGSAAGALAAYLWKYRGTQSVVVHQGEEMGRGATILAQVSDDGAIVKVGGSAVIVAQGDIKIGPR